MLPAGISNNDVARSNGVTVCKNRRRVTFKNIEIIHLGEDDTSSSRIQEKEYTPKLKSSGKDVLPPIDLASPACIYKKTMLNIEFVETCRMISKMKQDLKLSKNKLMKETSFVETKFPTSQLNEEAMKMILFDETTNTNINQKSDYQHRIQRSEKRPKLVVRNDSSLSPPRPPRRNQEPSNSSLLESSPL